MLFSQSKQMSWHQLKLTNTLLYSYVCNFLLNDPGEVSAVTAGEEKSLGKKEESLESRLMP